MGLLHLSLVSVLVFSVAYAQCSYISNNDYDQGSGGPNSPANGPADCCAQCIAAGNSTCYAAVYDEATGGVCWLKTRDQTSRPIWSPGLIACWPPGSVPPTPPPPPPPPLYGVTVISRSATPVVSFLPPLSNTLWPQSFNPAFVEPTSGTAGKRGLLVRSQNCTAWSPGQCIGCNVDGGHPISPWFPGSVITFSQQQDDGTFAPPYLVFAPRTDNDDELYGTEDPRLAYDARTGLYHMMYTCYGKSGGRLCHATTPDPTAPYPGNWTRLGGVFGVGTKSGALLIRPQPPHYLYWGDSRIAFATSDDLVTFKTVNDSFITTRPGGFDTVLVEAGPPPLPLSDGNFIFFHNSANSTRNCYHPGYVILNGTDFGAFVQRSSDPLLSPIYDWEIGNAPAECNVGCVVFLEAAAPVVGSVDTFDVWYGGSDAVIGTARVKVTKL